MPRDLTTTMFQFLARSTRAEFVPTCFGHDAVVCKAAGNQRRFRCDAMCSKILVDIHHPAAVPIISFSLCSAPIGSLYGRISGSGSCSCAKAKIGTSEPQWFSSLKSTNQSSLLNSIPRRKPFANRCRGRRRRCSLTALGWRHRLIPRYGDGFLVARNQWKELLQYRLCRECLVVSLTGGSPLRSENLLAGNRPKVEGSETAGWRWSAALAIYVQGDIDQSTNSLGARRLILLRASPVVEPL